MAGMAVMEAVMEAVMTKTRWEFNECSMVPSLRPVEMPTVLTLPSGATLAGQALAVIDAAAAARAQATWSKSAPTSCFSTTGPALINACSKPECDHPTREICSPLLIIALGPTIGIQGNSNAVVFWEIGVD